MNEARQVKGIRDSSGSKPGAAACEEARGAIVVARMIEGRLLQVSSVLGLVEGKMVWLVDGLGGWLRLVVLGWVLAVRFH
ncbi:MAG: hypothetical protein AAB864_01660 [Patescibacteria group bacterium]